MGYRIDITKDKDSWLPNIDIKKKDNPPKGAKELAMFLGAEGGYSLGYLLTAKPFEDAINKEIRNKANSLYESAGRRVPSIIEDITNGNRALSGLPPREQVKFAKHIGSPFLDKVISKAKNIKAKSTSLSYLDALRKIGQSSAEAGLAGALEKGVKSFSTPMGRFGKRLGTAISGALLARLIVSKYYE